ncbi:hypothetical protein PXD56_13690 [Maribacter sp. SA7]|uniref:hypothetical protein n=1 Tax=Maribacter zhoushanensis TaxID=3030012 RepID=UPI0023EB1974|nr:hypothetical protein [Maribacter zhoushanensis]MDF4204020.1 hypothetical protein [Maribacter zhoushanensis]
MNYNPDFEKALKDYQVNQDYTVEPFAEPFRKEQYDIAKNTLDNYLEGFKYIYNRLTDNNKEEFKFDTLDYLNKIQKSQTSSKFKNLFTKITIEIESFEGYDSYYIPFEKELFSMEDFKNLAIIACSKLPGALDFFLADNDDKYEYRFWNEGLICYDYKLRLSAISSQIKLLNEFKLSIKTDKGNIIHSEMIAKYYSNGYNEGLIHWKNELALNLNQDPSETYLKRIKHFYFNENFDLPSGVFYPIGKIRGCSFVKVFDYEKISLYGIKTLGYYTSITNEIDKFLKKINKEIIISSKQTEKDIDSKKELIDYFFNLNNKSKCLQELKEVFNTEKGIQFGILIDQLKESQVLKIGNREFKNFHECAQSFFTQNIGSRISVRAYVDKGPETYHEEIEIISIKLLPIIAKYRTN